MSTFVHRVKRRSNSDEQLFFYCVTFIILKTGLMKNTHAKIKKIETLCEMRALRVRTNTQFFCGGYILLSKTFGSICKN